MPSSSGSSGFCSQRSMTCTSILNSFLDRKLSTWVLIKIFPHKIVLTKYLWLRFFDLLSVIYESCSIALLIRSIFGSNVSTIGWHRRARSSISCLPSLNDLHHLWMILSEGASSTANEFKSFQIDRCASNFFKLAPFEL